MSFTLEEIQRYFKNKITVGGRWTGKATMCEIYKELVAYKKIEKELGISISILFTALRKGIYVRTWGFANSHVGKDIIVKIRVPKLKLDYETHTYFAFEFMKKGITQTYKLCDYGKTWALTKEELTNGK